MSAGIKTGNDGATANIVVNGVIPLSFTGNQVNVSLPGSNSLPSVTFGTDNDTGLFQTTNGDLGFSGGGINVMEFHNGGLTVNSKLTSNGGINTATPSNPVNIEIGDIWYGEDTNKLKMMLPINAWCSVNGVLSPRFHIAGSGTSTDALAFGGWVGYPIGNTLSLTEIYNGSVWSTRNDLITPKYSLGGCGSSNATLAFGGANFGGVTGNTEYYDGVTWSTRNSLITARTLLMGCGTASDALITGGSSSDNYLSSTEYYDGSVWSARSNLITARRTSGNSGMASDALVFGGRGSGVGIDYLSSTEYYDGLVWSARNNLIAATRGMSGCGTSTAALGINGATTGEVVSTITEFYNGSVWSFTSSAIEPRNFATAVGSATSALLFGGLTLQSIQSNGSILTTYNTTAELYKGNNIPTQTMSIVEFDVIL